MPTRDELMAEARRRGLIKDTPPSDGRAEVNRRALIAEAKRRKLVGDDFEGGELETSPSRLTAIRKGLADGLTFGFADEIGAYLPINAVTGRSDEIYRKLNDETSAAYSEYPGTALLSQIAGGLATGGVGATGALTANVLRASTPVAKAAIGAGAGAVGGGLAGAGYAPPGHKEEAAMIGGSLGAVLGAAAGPLSSRVQSAVDKFRARTPEGAQKVAADYVGAHVAKGGPQKLSAIVEAMSAKPQPQSGVAGTVGEMAMDYAMAGTGRVINLVKNTFVGQPKPPKRVIDALTKIVEKEDPTIVRMYVNQFGEKDWLRNYMARNAGGIAFGGTVPQAVGSGVQR